MALSNQPENSGNCLLWCLDVHCYTSLYQEERLAGALVMLTAYISSYSFRVPPKRISTQAEENYLALRILHGALS